MITVIITCHKDRGYISECINSIKENGFADHEIIIASDGCEEMRKYAKHGIKFSLSPKGNLASNFNRAVEMAKGKYIKIIADDDMLYPGALEVLYSEAEDLDADCVFGHIVIQGFDLKRTELKLPDMPLKDLITNRKMCGGAHIIKTESFRKVGGFDEQFNIAESYILYFKLINAGFDKFSRVEYPIAIYRHHDQQKSLHLSPEKQEERRNEMALINKKYYFV